MNRSILGVLTAAAITLSTSLVASPSANAARCVSGAEVRGQVAAFVHGLHDDIDAPKTRAAIKTALVESVRTARGAKAETPHEQRGLGVEISALARQMHTAEDAVARAALRTAIHALQEQKRADHFSARDAAELKRDVAHLGKKIAQKTDSRGEGRQVAAFAHALMAQFTC